MPGGSDGVEVQLAHLEHAGLVLEPRLGAGDRHIHVDKIGVGDRPVLRWRRGIDVARLTPCGRVPALARELAKRGGRGAADDDAEVVKRRVSGAIGVAAARVARRMLGRIPAVESQVEAAHEADAVVDDDELLMMRRTHGMPVIGLEFEPVLRL